jgi:hypothetical protein
MHCTKQTPNLRYRFFGETWCLHLPEVGDESFAEASAMIYQSTRLHIPGDVSAEISFSYKEKKFWEDLVACFPFTTYSLIRHGRHRKLRVQNSSYACLCVRCRGNVFTDPLPSKDKGGYTETQTPRRVHNPPFFSEKESRLQCTPIIFLTCSIRSDCSMCT